MGHSRFMLYGENCIMRNFVILTLILILPVPLNKEEEEKRLVRHIALTLWYRGSLSSCQLFNWGRNSVCMEHEGLWPYS
jgi:hypothetical protein